MRLKFLIIVGFLFLFLPPLGVFAQEKPSLGRQEVLEGTTTEILEEKETELEGQKQLYQKLEILVTKGLLKDRKIVIEAGNLPVVFQQKYERGDKILVNYSKDFAGNDMFYITDFVRRDSLAVLFFIFVALAVLVGGWQGASSLLGMGFSFLIIFKFILPRILAGRDPVLVAILGSLFIIPFAFYLSHGLNKKTTVAMIGTFASLVITGILAKIFVEAAKLTGYASEEAAFLQVARKGVMNVKGLLLAGIIVGALGILDDITVAQAAVVEQLRRAKKKIPPKELFLRAMSVGQDHIASVVNTLVLVYTGAALPLLLLFVNNPHPFGEVINYEIVAEEIIRTLVASIGLISAVPITTFLACSIRDK